MDINDILSKLGLDLSSPEARRGAIEAIDAILTSREPVDSGSMGGGSMGGSNETEVELDPDLLQPSIKQNQPSGDDEDIEIEDEENILDQIKHKDSEDPIENTNSGGNDSKSDKESSNSQETENDNTSIEDSDEKPKSDKNDAGKSANNDKPESSTTNSEEDKSTNKSSDDDKVDREESSRQSDDGEEDDYDETDDADDEFDDPEDDSIEDDENTSSNPKLKNDYNDGDSDSSNSDFDDDFDYEDDDDSGIDFGDEDDDFDFRDEDEDGDSDSDNEGEGTELGDGGESEGDSESDDESTEDEEEFDFDEDDFIDSDLNASAEDEEVKTKHNSRKIKRERTLAAARQALAAARTKNVAPALIRELEKSIEALEALTEAVAKSLKDISDEEFNRLINRVLDAIDACGNSGLTYSSEEERQAKVQEIKTDLAKATTQTELSAEDVAKIRSETQAIKAREKEVDKYKMRAAGSFRGFQDFLNSLYRAIALQVNTEEARDDSWSAINRRYSGTGILQPGKKMNELPNKKIPVIDFYFDCSNSWTSNDIKVGKKAVAALADMEEKGQIKVNLYYFGDEVSTNYSDVAGQTTSGWNEIVKNVIATQATNVVIMTDRDMQNWWTGPKALTYTVPGYVWYLWKNGLNAPRLPRDLKGRGGVQQFSFNASDV